VTDRQTEFRRLRRAIAVPAFVRKKAFSNDLVSFFRIFSFVFIFLVYKVFVFGMKIAFTGSVKSTPTDTARRDKIKFHGTAECAECG